MAALLTWTTLLANLSMGQGLPAAPRVRLQAAVVVASTHGAPGETVRVLRPLERRLRSLLPYSNYQGFTEYTAALSPGEGLDLKLPDGRKVRLTPEPTPAERAALQAGPRLEPSSEHGRGTGHAEPLANAPPAEANRYRSAATDAPGTQPPAALPPTTFPPGQPRVPVRPRGRPSRSIHVAVERGEEFDSRVVCDNALVFQVHNGTADRPGERTFLVFTVACPGDRPLRLMPDPQ